MDVHTKLKMCLYYELKKRFAILTPFESSYSKVLLIKCRRYNTIN